MAKGKRKLSAAQIDKSLIAKAKELKKRGFLSKQTKLHSGNYISKAVARKVKTLDYALIADYKTIKVNKKHLEIAKAQGFEIFGRRLAVPNDQKFINRLIKNDLTIGIRPAKGGTIESVVLPSSVMDIKKLVATLGKKGGIDDLKLPDEQFAFKYKGHFSYRGFANSSQLLEYLLHYKGIEGALESESAEDMQEEFENLSFIRYNKYDTAPLPGREEREKWRKNKFALDRKSVRAKKTRAERIAQMHPIQQGHMKQRAFEKEVRKMEKLQSEPDKYAAYLEKSNARAKASYEARKNNPEFKAARKAASKAWRDKVKGK
jgi:hypothetical protein